ncbi:PEPxxWA-CTERM sorting domain-containing protein [Sphingomonas sp. 1P06PA]|uniref:PEPxxWA-CTERM sorting domain-containing protein n=1 Tax=Sphingomonas sp. 1P06PA TaxID=554121 RepID=UPI0039A51AED
MKRAFLAVTCCIAALAAAPASAAPVTYTLAGTFGIAGVPIFGTITAPLSFVGMGDTEVYGQTTIGGLTANIFELESFTASYRGFSIDLGSSLRFGAASDLGIIGFGDSATGLGAVFRSPALIGYDGRSSIGPVPLTFLGVATGMGGGSSFATPALLDTYGHGGHHGGPRITAVANATFTAVVSAVPEPAAWALMIGGFGLVGAALRRARVSQVRYAG